MTKRRRNLLIIGSVVGLLVAAVYAIVEKPTRLGLDLRGGVELVYQARPTPKVPEVTPAAIEDAIRVIRDRTDALGVSEPEIQRGGEDQIRVGLPNVENAARAIQQVGTTAQLQFYDWEPNLIPLEADQPDRPFPSLFEAVLAASKASPRGEAEDILPGGAEPAVGQRFGGDEQRIRDFYDRQNDTGADKYYLFGPNQKPIAGPAASCGELLSDFEDRAGAPPPVPPRAAKGGGECRAELAALGASGPPPGSRVIRVPQGIVVVQAERPRNLPPSAPFNQHYVLEDDSELSGGDIQNPEQNTDGQTREPVVTFEFTPRGQQAFARVTKRIAQRGAEQIRPPGTPPRAAFETFAITLDNRVVSRATIDFIENPEGIDGRTGAQITGIGSIQETRDLANNLRIGALPIELHLISQTQVSATLGQQALDQGILAGAAGLMLTLLFLIAFYRVLGVVAGVALVVYAVLLFAIVELIPITLTLPGIAGLILTLGVAADANIVIFERIKEEVRAGRSIPAAISGGYAKALRTIVDANVVTVGVAFILFMLATAGVKGFAFTLGVGTLVSLFTAVLATSAILGSMARTRLLGSRLALGAGEERVRWRFDFMGSSKWFFSMSGVIIAAGALAIAGLGIHFGIDFESGTRITAPLERPAATTEVRDALPPNLREAKVQSVDDPELGQNVVQISTPELPPDQVAGVQQALDDRFGVSQGDFITSSVGPTFGAQIADTAVIAIIASLALISLYIGLRFEFKFAVPVLIALAHDILITAGVYALTEREVTTSTVAALLTILGYSLYDTIIVFDRIRENVPRMPRATFSQIVNRSMSEVLTRSLVTSLSTLFPITALLFFGGETLQDFAFALLVGVASGTYSSVFIASPVLALWKEREPVYTRRRQLALADHGGVIPAFAEPALGTEAGGERPARGRARAGQARPEPAEAEPVTGGSPGPDAAGTRQTPGAGGAQERGGREPRRPSTPVPADRPAPAPGDGHAGPSGDREAAPDRAGTGQGGSGSSEEADDGRGRGGAVSSTGPGRPSGSKSSNRRARKRHGRR